MKKVTNKPEARAEITEEISSNEIFRTINEAAHDSYGNNHTPSWYHLISSLRESPPESERVRTLSDQIIEIAENRLEHLSIYELYYFIELICESHLLIYSASLRSSLFIIADSKLKKLERSVLEMASALLRISNSEASEYAENWLGILREGLNTKPSWIVVDTLLALVPTIPQGVYNEEKLYADIRKLKLLDSESFSEELEIRATLIASLFKRSQDFIQNKIGCLESFAPTTTGDNIRSKISAHHKSICDRAAHGPSTHPQSAPPHTQTTSRDTKPRSHSTAY
jgi:hypothetical protein